MRWWEGQAWFYGARRLDFERGSVVIAERERVKERRRRRRGVGESE